MCCMSFGDGTSSGDSDGILRIVCVKIIQEVWWFKGKNVFLHKIGGISAIEASFIAFDLHNLCKLIQLNV